MARTIPMTTATTRRGVDRWTTSGRSGPAERRPTRFDGDVTFHDCDEAAMFPDGGADDAGFVQFMGRVTDPEQCRSFMDRPWTLLQKAPPEIIEGTIAMEPDGPIHRDRGIHQRGV